MTQHATQTENSPDQEENLPPSGETLGGYLKRHRLRLGKTLEQVAKDTRIHASTLQAIEENNKKALPAEVFTRGFIKIYAQHLGLDANEALARHLRQLSGEPVAEEKINVQEVLSSESLAEQPSFSFGKILAYLLVAACLLLAGYWVFTTNQTPTEQSQPLGSQTDQQPSASEPPLPSPPAAEQVPTPPPSETGEPPAATETPLPEEGLPAGTVPPQVEEGTAEPPPTAPPAGEAAGSAPTEEELAAQESDDSLTPPGTKVIAPLAEKKRLQQAEADPEKAPVAAANASETPVKATTQAVEPARDAAYVLEADFTLTTWIKIRIDDEKARSYTYHPGDHPVWQAKQKIDLFVGNAGGIALTLNKKALPPMGKPGQTARLSLP